MKKLMAPVLLKTIFFSILLQQSMIVAAPLPTKLPAGEQD
jgi:hypothetical protein